MVVDYVGIATALKQAMNDYTVRDRNNYGDPDISKQAYPKFKEKLEVCQDLFHGHDYSKFKTGSDLDRTQAISDATNFIIAPNYKDRKDTFLKEALMLRQALSLCQSIVQEEDRIEAAFFEAVRVLVMRLTTSGENKKKFLDFVNAWGVVNGESNLDSFMMGFRLGANFTYDTFIATDTPFQDLLKE